METRSSASRLERGSSRRKATGLRTMARPMATRWRWPPESWPGRRSRSGSISSMRAACGDALGDLGAGEAGVLEAEGEVLAHGHVRVEGVGLEDHGEAAVGGAGLGDVAAVDGDAAGGGAVEAGDEAQQRGLAAAGGADEDHELAVRDVEGDVADDLGGAEGLVMLVREMRAISGGSCGRSAFALRESVSPACAGALRAVARGSPHPPSPRPQGRGNLPDREGRGAGGRDRRRGGPDAGGGRRCRRRWRRRAPRA